MKKAYLGNPGDITPAELAAELGHVEQRPGLKVRNWLRSRHGKLPNMTYEWRIPKTVADEIRAYFRRL